MIIFTIDDGYYDNGKVSSEIILKHNDRFFWDLNFLARGQFYFYLVLEIKKKTRLKKGDFKIGIINDDPTIIGLSKEIGTFKKGFLEISCGKVVIDQIAFYHLFVESEHSEIIIKRLIIKHFPIPIKGSPTIVWEEKQAIPVLSEPLSDDKRHAKVAALRYNEISNKKMLSYYQNFKLNQNYPFSYYAIDFGFGNIGIQYNQSLEPNLNLVIWKKQLIEIMEFDPELEITGQKNSPSIRFEKELKDSSNDSLKEFDFFIRMHHIEVDKIQKTEFMFYFGFDKGILDHLLTLRISSLLEKPKYEFYFENLGNINGHLYRRELQVYPPWMLTYDLGHATPLMKASFILKDQNSDCQVEDGYYLLGCGGPSRSHQTSLVSFMEMKTTHKVKLPRLKLTSLKKDKKGKNK